jgi:hypothetical protein
LVKFLSSFLDFLIISFFTKLSVNKPEFTVKLREDEKAKSFHKLNFDPRELQNNLKGELKVFKRGEKFYVKVDGDEEQSSMNLDRQIRKKI